MLYLGIGMKVVFMFKWAVC